MARGQPQPESPMGSARARAPNAAKRAGVDGGPNGYDPATAVALADAAQLARGARHRAWRVVVEPQRRGMARLWELACESDEVRTTVPVPRLETDFIRYARGLQLVALQRGLRLRSLFPREIVTHFPSLVYVRDLVAAGAQARYSPGLPTWLTIIDQDIVIVPLDPDRPGGDVLFVYGGGHVRLAIWAFDAAWQAAAPLLNDDGSPVLTDMERSVLAYLTAGVKDESGARLLGISARTYRRCVADLCSRLGASSRFEAGVRAAQAGLISWVL
jgi:DNA-binding CsgD family transcriptional regulator